MVAERTAVVTGAAGFVGSCLCRRLSAEGWRVVGIRYGARDLDPQIEWLCHDLRKPIEPATWPEHVDALFHTAADRQRSDLGPHALAREIAINVLACAHLYAWAESCGVPAVVHLSTASVYRLLPHDAAPYDEDAPQTDEGGHPYALTKSWGEQTARRLGSSKGSRKTKACILRPSNIYGPGQPTRTLVGMLEDKLAADEPIELSGSEGHRVAPIFVDDLIAVMMLAAASAEAHILNVAGAPLSLRAVVTDMAQVLGHEARFQPQPDEPTFSLAPSSARLDRVFPERPRTSWLDGLRATYRAST